MLSLQRDLINCLFFRDHKLRVFVFGDYEFLCALYGITGANGNTLIF